MKDELKHLKLTIESQNEMLNKKDKEIEHLKFLVKRSNKYLSNLIDVIEEYNK